MWIAVFLLIVKPIALGRLREREAMRFGLHAIQPGGHLYNHHREFVNWAAEYDDGSMATRSRAGHTAWLEQLNSGDDHTF